MGKLLLSMMIGALLMVAAEKWQLGDLSAAQVLAALQDMSRNAGQTQLSVQR